jgi:hypothetical protein
MDTPAIKSRMLEIGVTGIEPERRSPEYLAKFVADEVARWEGPIKGRRAAGGLSARRNPVPLVGRDQSLFQGAGSPATRANIRKSWYAPLNQAFCRSVPSY